MKKLILSLALCCAATNFFAQNTDPAQLVNEGKAALESKNYQLAFTKFSTYLTQTNNQDSVIAFNCGVCADKIKKPADALKYFYLSKQFSIQGVPTYIIVDKEGGIIQKYTGFPGVDTVKKELIKALEK